MNKELIQVVDISIYRLLKSMEGVGKDFYGFSAGNQWRTPMEILSHLVDVTHYALSILISTSDGQLSDVDNQVASNLNAIKASLADENYEIQI